ncbi:MAG: metallophosphoesterase family protein, partial [Bacteroidaceae bacterium]
FTLEGMKALMMHIGGYPGRYDGKALQLIAAHRPNLFVCGHSHILKVMHDSKYGMLFINPGAAGLQGWQKVRTLVRLEVEGKTFRNLEVYEIKRENDF